MGKPVAHLHRKQQVDSKVRQRHAAVHVAGQRHVVEDAGELVGHGVDKQLPPFLPPCCCPRHLQEARHAVPRARRCRRTLRHRSCCLLVFPLKRGGCNLGSPRVPNRRSRLVTAASSGMVVYQPRPTTTWLSAGRRSGRTAVSSSARTWPSLGFCQTPAWCDPTPSWPLLFLDRPAGPRSALPPRSIHQSGAVIRERRHH